MTSLSASTTNQTHFTHVVNDYAEVRSLSAAQRERLHKSLDGKPTLADLTALPPAASERAIADLARISRYAVSVTIAKSDLPLDEIVAPLSMPAGQVKVHAYCNVRNGQLIDYTLESKFLEARNITARVRPRSTVNCFDHGAAYLHNSHTPAIDLYGDARVIDAVLRLLRAHGKICVTNQFGRPPRVVVAQQAATRSAPAALPSVATVLWNLPLTSARTAYRLLPALMGISKP